MRNLIQLNDNKERQRCFLSARTMQQPFGRVLVCLTAIVAAVTTLGFSLRFSAIQRGRSLQTQRGLTGADVDGNETTNGRLASKRKKVYTGFSGHNTTIKRSHLFKEKMSKFASRYRTDQTNDTHKFESYLTGSKRIVGGKFLLYSSALLLTFLYRHGRR
jgi:hypothetical protein